MKKTHILRPDGKAFCFGRLVTKAADSGELCQRYADADAEKTARKTEREHNRAAKIEAKATRKREREEKRAAKIAAKEARRKQREADRAARLARLEAGELFKAHTGIWHLRYMLGGKPRSASLNERSQRRAEMLAPMILAHVKKTGRAIGDVDTCNADKL